MNLVYTTVLLLLTSSALLAQVSPIIKTRTTYSLRDTVGIDFNDSSQIAKYVWFKAEYNRSGKPIKEIDYPFPHNPTMYLTTKITTYQYVEDSTKVFVYDGSNELVSGISTYSKRNEMFSKTVNYGTLNSSYYKSLDTTLITEVTHDSLNNIVTVLHMKVKGNRIDTTRTYQYPITSIVDSAVLARRLQTRIVPMDTIRTSTLLQYGHFRIVSGDTVYTLIEKVLKIDSVTSLIESLEIVLKQGHHVYSRTISTSNKGRIVNSEFQRLENKTWQTAFKMYYEYDHFNNMTLQIRDDYREGKFSYRFVTYIEFEYYD